MGLVKSDWMEAEERGWSSVDKLVCSRCVNDVALKQVLRPQARPAKCDYCNRRGNATPVEVLQEALYSTALTYYHEPTDAGVPWDGGFVIDPIDIEQVFYELGFDGHQGLIADIIDADMGSCWVAASEGHWASSHEHEVMLDSWLSFSDVIKHKTRFHFGAIGETSTAGPRDIEPARMLRVLGERLQPYIRLLAKGTLVYRVRTRGKKESWKPEADELGAPPPEKARAGRMNPAGIPYLYTAFDTETALRETRVAWAAAEAVFMATFELTESLLVIDLTRLLAPPSVFDLERKNEREKVLFAQGFVNAISKPVSKNGQEHIEYVPSQVVCEYLAQIFKPSRGPMLGGLIFPSSVHDDGRNLVVFPSERGLEQSFHGVEFRSAVRARRGR
jgi:RES domain-containing protein